MFRQLNAQKLHETTRGFAGRIAAEFPGSGLAQVGQEVTRVADDAVRITRGSAGQCGDCESRRSF